MRSRRADRGDHGVSADERPWHRADYLQRHAGSRLASSSISLDSSSTR
jgi:hypothetical protein